MKAGRTDRPVTTPGPAKRLLQSGGHVSEGRPGALRACTLAPFTLLEIVLVILLSAVLFAAVLGALRGVMVLRQRADEAQEADILQQHCLDAIAADLRCVVPPGGVLCDSFSGEAEDENGVRRDHLEFSASSNLYWASVFGGDIVRVLYELREPEDDDAEETGWELMRYVTRNVLSLTEEEPDEIALLPAVKSLEFAYYSNEEWLESWDSTLQEDQLPEAIRVRIIPMSDAEDGEAAPLDLVVPVQVEAREEAEQQEQQQGGQP